MALQPSGILETALYVRDLDRGACFYADVIGLIEETRVEGRHVFFRCGQGMLLLFDPAATQTSGGQLPVPPHGATGAGHVCFRASASELDEWCLHFRRCGLDIEADFRWPNGARSVYVRDPGGNSVEFAEPKLWGFE